MSETLGKSDEEVLRAIVLGECDAEDHAVRAAAARSPELARRIEQHLRLRAGLVADEAEWQEARSALEVPSADEQRLLGTFRAHTLLHPFSRPRRRPWPWPVLVFALAAGLVLWLSLRPRQDETESGYVLGEPPSIVLLAPDRQGERVVLRWTPCADARLFQYEVSLFVMGEEGALTLLERRRVRAAEHVVDGELPETFVWQVQPLDASLTPIGRPARGEAARPR